jgi:hypothetical protein
LGWYDDRVLELDYRDLPWGGSLSAFVDYRSTGESEYVVLRLNGRANDKSLFLQYNRKRDFNSGTQEFPGKGIVLGATETIITNLILPDRVTIVEADMSQTYPTSNFRGVVSPNSNGLFRLKNFANTGFGLVVKGCRKLAGTPEGVQLSLFLDDGVQTDTC